MQLGTTMKDKITGFSGIATAHARYLSGCHQTLIVPKIDEKGSYRSGEWFDDQRLEKLGDEIVTLDNGETPGCDREAPKR